MRRMKRRFGALLALVLLAAPASAAGLTVQRVEVLGVPLDLSAYTVYNEWGYATNYVRLRDVAWALQFTTDRFNVSYDGSTRVDTGQGYIPDGTEMTGLPDGATAQATRAVITVNGAGHPLNAYLITPPDSTAGNFYFKLRDLGTAIGFTVGWSAEQGVYIETW